MPSGFVYTHSPWYGTGVLYPDGTLYTFDNCTVAACPIQLSVYGYRPTFPGSVTLIALYLICAVIQIVLGIRYKMWGFMAAMVLGCVDEALGYVGRILYNQDPWAQTGFLMQIVLITIGPVFFVAAIYVMLYKIVHYIDVTKSRVNPKWFYWFFIICDTISLVLQAVGGAMSSTSNGVSTVGVNIALAGLIFQVITLAFFCVIAADYAWRVRHNIKQYGVNRRFKIFVAFLTLAIITIFIRCCYRVYELSEGYNSSSKALRDEPLFIGLEMVMVIIAAYALIVAHPGFVFNRGQSGPSEKRAIEREEKTAITRTPADVSE